MSKSLDFLNHSISVFITILHNLCCTKYKIKLQAIGKERLEIGDVFQVLDSFCSYITLSSEVLQVPDLSVEQISTCTAEILFH